MRKIINNAAGGKRVGGRVPHTRQEEAPRYWAYEREATFLPSKMGHLVGGHYVDPYGNLIHTGLFVRTYFISNSCIKLERKECMFLKESLQNYI